MVHGASRQPESFITSRVLRLSGPNCSSILCDQRIAYSVPSCPIPRRLSFTSTSIRVPASSTDTASANQGSASTEAAAEQAHGSVKQPKGPTGSRANEWSVGEARETYGVRRWGNDYFDIDESGRVIVNTPTAKGVQSVPLTAIIDGLQQRGLETPVMLRLENLVDDRIVRLNDCLLYTSPSPRDRG